MRLQRLQVVFLKIIYKKYIFPKKILLDSCKMLVFVKIILFFMHAYNIKSYLKFFQKHGPYDLQRRMKIAAFDVIAVTRLHTRLSHIFEKSGHQIILKNKIILLRFHT